MSKHPSPVLLIRINCVAELTNTSDALDVIRQTFPDNPLVAISAANSEGLELLKSDPRLDSVRIFSIGGRTSFERMSSLAKSLGRIGGTKATVIFYGATDGLNYYKHVLRGLLFGGAKYIMGPDMKLVKVVSGRGAKAVFASLRQALTELIAVKLLLTRYPDGTAVRPLGAPILKAGERILLIKLDSIGDVVATLPVIQALSAAIGSPVDILVRSEMAPILKPLLFVDTVHTYGHVHMLAFDAATHQLIANLRKRRYDIVVDLTGNSLTARLFARLTGSGIRIGLTESSRETSHTGIEWIHEKIELVNSDDDYTSRGQFVAKELGIRDNLPAFVFNPSDESRTVVNEVLRAHGIKTPFAALHLRPSTAFKSWRMESFVNVSDYLIDRYGFDIVLTGSPADREYNESLKTLVTLPDRVFNLAGEIGLSDIASLYDAAKITVAVDTGPAHIAGATRCALVVVGYHSPFGRTDALIRPDPQLAMEMPGRPLYAISVQSVRCAIDRAIGGRQ